jgi:hypothetical protein
MLGRPGEKWVHKGTFLLVMHPGVALLCIQSGSAAFQPSQQTIKCPHLRKRSLTEVVVLPAVVSCCAGH